MAKTTDLIKELIRDTVGKRELPIIRRRYSAAKASRLNSDWSATPTSENYELRLSLRALRARAREQARNNGVFKRFLTKARSNVIGQGIRLQCTAKFAKGTPNTKLNSMVEDLFAEWSDRRNCSMSEKISFWDAQRIFVTRLLRDGEVLVQKVNGGPWGFALHFIDADYLDETYNEINASTGNRIIMSVEVDEWGKPVAYWLTPPRLDYLFQPVTERRERDRKRVPADQFIHAFLTYDDPEATRGKTAFHSALTAAKDAEGYKIGVISSARAAAYSFGMLRPPMDDTEQFYGEGTQAPMEVALEPLTIQEIPPGYEFVQFDPKQPTQNHAQFYQSIMQDLAMSLDLHYFSLSGDLSAVNYSSARVGLLEERDVWKDLQRVVIDQFCREIFNAWLEAQILRGTISPSDAQAVNRPTWRPRGWQWVDPQKEVKAKVEAIQAGLTTYTATLAEQGIDLEEHLQTIKAERDLAASYDVDLLDLGGEKEEATQAPPPPADTEEV